MAFGPLNRLALWGVIVSMLCIGTASSYAQTVFQPWESIQGTASDISVSQDGYVAAIDQSGTVYLLDHSDESWQPVGRNMVRIAGGSPEILWGIDTQGTLRQYTGTSWLAVGRGALDLALAPNGHIYVVTNTNSIAAYDPAKKKWWPVKGKATRLAFDMNGVLWAVLLDGSVARQLDSAWIGLDIKATDLTIDQSAKRVFIIDATGAILQWHDEELSWTPAAPTSDTIALAAGDGQLWRVDQTGRMYAQGISESHRNKDSGIVMTESGGSRSENQKAVASSNLVFTKIASTQKLAELSVGKDGSIFGLTSTGDIKRFSNSEKDFYTFSGQLEVLDVQNDGLPIGIGTKKNLVKYDGEAWRQTYLNVDLNDVTIFGDDQALGLNHIDQVAKLSDNLRSYQLLQGSGKKIVANKDGSFWKIDSSDRLFECDTSGACNQKSLTAIDIDVGPAGSVYIVDSNRNLRRFNPETNTFDDIVRGQGDVGRVALGPNDYPWFIDTSGNVYSSKYFDRDESQDRNDAFKSAATENVTTTESGSTGSGIQIVTNMSFSAVTIPTTSSEYGTVGSGMRDITSGWDDVVIATGYDDPCSAGSGRNWIYNPLTASFNYMDYLNRADIMVGLAAEQVASYNSSIDGDTPPTSVEPNITAFFGLWAYTCTTPELLEYVSSVFTDSTNEANNSYRDAVLYTPLVAGATSDLDIAKDGMLTFINTKNELKHFYPQTAADTTVRTDKNYLRVGVGVDIDDLWIVDTSNNVYEYNSKTDDFDLRSSRADDQALDVGVGHDGSVYIINLSGTLKRWNETANRFDQINKTGMTRVAVDSKGKPIVGNFPDSQIVYWGR